MGAGRCGALSLRIWRTTAPYDEGWERRDLVTLVVRRWVLTAVMLG